MIVLQLILFCALFTLMVKIGVGNNALNDLYFYPKPVQERFMNWDSPIGKRSQGSENAL
jgi:hypothetical protein